MRRAGTNWLARHGRSTHPANVRIYDVAGASHVRGSQGCELPPGELDWSPVMRAVLVALDQWVSGNRAPPPNSLMPIAERRADETVLAAPAHLPNAVIQGNHYSRRHTIFGV
jgi:hypothetical protein